MGLVESGLDALATADVAIFYMRFLQLPEEQLKHVLTFVESGKPGYAVAGDGRLVLALDTELDDDEPSAPPVERSARPQGPREPDAEQLADCPHLIAEWHGRLVDDDTLALGVYQGVRCPQVDRQIR